LPAWLYQGVPPVQLLVRPLPLLRHLGLPCARPPGGGLFLTPQKEQIANREQNVYIAPCCTSHLLLAPSRLKAERHAGRGCGA
jgi:hypothetical protein